jgi:hypothetical protein
MCRTGLKSIHTSSVATVKEKNHQIQGLGVRLITLTSTFSIHNHMSKYKQKCTTTTDRIILKQTRNHYESIGNVLIHMECFPLRCFPSYTTITMAYLRSSILSHGINVYGNRFHVKINFSYGLDSLESMPKCP